MCTVLLPPGDNPIAVNKYIIHCCACYLHWGFLKVITQEVMNFCVLILFSEVTRELQDHSERTLP